MKLIAKLLQCIKHHYFSLDLFNDHEVDVAIEFLWFYLFLSYLDFTIDTLWTDLTDCRPDRFFGSSVLF